MIISEALRLAPQLQHSDSPRLDAEVLLAEALGKTRTFLYTWPEHALSEPERMLYLQWLERRARGEPIAYILQRREFWSLPLEVNAATLIPRPDTEILVERALAIIANQGLSTARILDLGTGTGAIALALASELPQAQVTAVDFSVQAVALAQRNGQRLAIHNAHFLQSDWYQSVQGPFDVIVSNPPYIDHQDPHLHEGDVRYEPRTALVAEEQGLADLFAIASAAPNYLSASGWLLLEHGWQQAEVLRRHLYGAGFDNVFTIADYAGLDRVSGGQWHG